jgi:hypothetical protein
MDLVCPLCRSGRLTLSPRSLDFGERSFDVSVHQCSTCRETLLAPEALAELKRAIREAGLGATDAEIEDVALRAILRSE